MFYSELLSSRNGTIGGGGSGMALGHYLPSNDDMNSVAPDSPRLHKWGEGGGVGGESTISIVNWCARSAK